MNFSQSSLLSFILLLFLPSCAQKRELATVQDFSPSRYAGTWHEIGRLPNSFERNIVAARAIYGLRPDGALSVLNEGVKANGKKTSIAGKATSVGNPQNGKLKVRFNPFPASLFAGDYWVLYIDEAYHTAIVGSPNRKYLWLLSKNPDASVKDFQQPLSILAEKGFETGKVILNPKRILP